jgi:hypothetical protein
MYGFSSGETLRTNFGVTAGSAGCERSGETGSAETGESKLEALPALYVAKLLYP